MDRGSSGGQRARSMDRGLAVQTRRAEGGDRVGNRSVSSGPGQLEGGSFAAGAVRAARAAQCRASSSRGSSSMGGSAAAGGGGD
jgi:hypothetical protein